MIGTIMNVVIPLRVVHIHQHHDDQWHIEQPDESLPITFSVNLN